MDGEDIKEEPVVTVSFMLIIEGYVTVKLFYRNSPFTTAKNNVDNTKSPHLSVR